jgi:hypothetical protein
MITDEQLALITAAVDGELNHAETVRFRRLLDTSTEARGIYVRLKADSARLRNLPHREPPADLRQKIMARLAAITPPPNAWPTTTPLSRPGQPQTRSVQAEPVVRLTSYRRSRPWGAVAVAAVLMVGVAASSFWFFSRNHATPGKPHHTQTEHSAEWAKLLPSEAGPKPTAPTLPEPGRGWFPVATAPAADPPPPLPNPPANAVATAPRPRPVLSALVGAPPEPEIPPLDLVQVRLPFLRQLAEFEREGIRQQFSDELARDPAFRIDLFARDIHRGTDCLKAAAKAAGVILYVDPTTSDRISKHAATSVVVYTEALNRTELAEFFGKLCVEDAKISPRVFDALHATPVMGADQRDLSHVLGTDPGLFKRAHQEKTPDISKPISAGTADHVVESLRTGQGKPTERSAILLTWKPDMARTVPSTSSEVKQFLSRRGERKASAVPVIIVIRPGN